MALQVFQTIAKQPELVNSYAGLTKTSDIKFSKVFKIFFPANGYKTDDNIVSWLDTFGNNFTFPKIYHQLRVGGYSENDNIFEFMNGFPIHKTKAVFLGNEPAFGVPSSGYAFHGSPCASTWQVLQFLRDEIQRVSLFNGIKDKDNVNWDENYSMSGWIQQGVLLMNAHPTLNFGNVHSLWWVFTDFVLKYLSDSLSNVVFILLGDVNDSKNHLIDPDRHWIICLYHPSKYCYRDYSEIDRDRDWDTMIPFTNAQFYMYQVRGDSLIDWGDVDGFGLEGKSQRFIQLQKLFDEAIQRGPSEIGSYERLNWYFIVVRNDKRYLTLKYWPKRS
ncbi:unnamed protein product [Orchesella dallaii]|uniref:Uracil-DNA glycosylase n=1 Tax=Orchesella dallaii TaxID=48710 RepID=A0ABP1QGI9_9HEXA